MAERIALFADLHSNLEAFEACMARASDLGATRYVFLGDLVGYNADPSALVDRVAELVLANRAVALMGNHDQAVFEDHSKHMNPNAWDAIQWTRTQLNIEQIEFLKRLPLVIEEQDTCYVHASADQPAMWKYVDSTASAQRCADASNKTYTFVGHAHHQALFHEGDSGQFKRFVPKVELATPMSRLRRWVAVVGALGQPRDGNPQSCFALFEPASATTIFCRVEYDYYATAEKVRRAGLPESLAERLLHGT